MNTVVIYAFWTPEASDSLAVIMENETVIMEIETNATSKSP
jgi:hypothetical protein